MVPCVLFYVIYYFMLFVIFAWNCYLCPWFNPNTSCLEDKEQALLFEVAAKNGNGSKDKISKCQWVETTLVNDTNEKEPIKRLTKFWQTPSPKKVHLDSSKDPTKLTSKDILIQDFQNFLNQKEDTQKELESGWLKEEENHYIEKLSKELSRV